MILWIIANRREFAHIEKQARFRIPVSSTLVPDTRKHLLDLRLNHRNRHGARIPSTNEGAEK